MKKMHFFKTYPFAVQTQPFCRPKPMLLYRNSASIVLIILHGAAMYAAMLLDDAAAVDGHHLAVGEDGGDALQGSLVVLWLMVCRNEDGTVDNQVVGVCRRQSTAVFVEDGVGKGQAKQRAVGRDAGNGVDMSVGVVAWQRLIVEPYDAVGTKAPFQFLLYLLLGHGSAILVVTVRSHKAAARGVYRTFAVALDGTTFQYEIVVVLVGGMGGRG